MKNNVVVLTTAFPQPDSCTNDYFCSLKDQTYKEFDIILVDDGHNDLAQWQLKYPSLSITILGGENNIAKNREKMINASIEQGYAKAIFADFDDYLSASRVAVSVEKLDSCGILVNELTLVCDNKVVSEGHFGDSLREGEEFTFEDVLEMNFFGLSNTGINLKDLKKISFDSGLKVVDWYFFSVLLLGGTKALYTKECKTFYRQHAQNMSNIGRTTPEQLINEISVKSYHYSLMINHHPYYEPLLEGVSDFSLKAKQSGFVEAYFEAISKKEKAPFWWSLFNLKEYWKIENEINKKRELI